MLVNSEGLRTLNVGFNAAFQSGFAEVPADWQKVAMKAPSSTLKSEYGWLGMFPKVREWIGDRIIQGMTAYKYEITNRDFELTITVKRNDIEDDNIGIYTPMMREVGRSTGDHPNELVMGLLANGFSSLCYDGQYFFDVDHPVIGADGRMISVANTDAVAGTGPAWFLLDTSRAMRPIIYQERKPFDFVAKDKPGDDNVFMRKEYLYGVDGRSNVGYGFWQLAWGSKKDLTVDNYAAARAAMQKLRGDYDHRLGIMPTTLVVPPDLEKQGRALLKAIQDAYGASNVWAGSADLIVSPWL